MKQHTTTHQLIEKQMAYIETRLTDFLKANDQYASSGSESDFKLAWEGFKGIKNMIRESLEAVAQEAEKNELDRIVALLPKECYTHIEDKLLVGVIKLKQSPQPEEECICGCHGGESPIAYICIHCVDEKSEVAHKNGESKHEQVVHAKDYKCGLYKCAIKGHYVEKGDS